MSDLKDFADQLQEEVVSDMAESYFGARKDLDNMLAAFKVMADELKNIVPRLSQSAARLHVLLLDRETARNFYISLDILPSCIPFTDEVPRPFFDSLPFAFTTLGRYERCVCRAYDRFQKTADEYLNGRYFDDHERPGRKRLTVHYLRLRALAEHINEEIVKVNDNMSPSGTLRFVRNMDPAQVAREDILGEACLVEGCGMDRDLRFEKIDFGELDLPLVQDLPPLRLVKNGIHEFCRGMYPARKKDMVKAMSMLREE